jgi:hypothetical protein
MDVYADKAFKNPNAAFNALYEQIMDRKRSHFARVRPRRCELIRCRSM